MTKTNVTKKGSREVKKSDKKQFPDQWTFFTFGRLIDLYTELSCGGGGSYDRNTLPPLPECVPATIVFEYVQLLGLLEAIESFDDGDAYQAVFIAIEEKTYEVAEMIADEYPALKPFFEEYTKRKESTDEKKTK